MGTFIVPLLPELPCFGHNGAISLNRYIVSIKYEYIYILPEENGAALYSGIKRFIDNYNYHRRHQGIDRQVPSKLYIRPAA